MLLGVVLFVAFPFEKEFSPFLVHLVFVIKKFVSYKRQHDSLFQFQLCGYCIVHRLIRSEISLKWHDMITIISPNELLKLSYENSKRLVRENGKDLEGLCGEEDLLGQGRG